MFRKPARTNIPPRYPEDFQIDSVFLVKMTQDQLKQIASNWVCPKSGRMTLQNSPKSSVALSMSLTGRSRIL
jgi:hypothetical protein